MEERETTLGFWREANVIKGGRAFSFGILVVDDIGARQFVFLSTLAV